MKSFKEFLIELGEYPGSFEIANLGVGRATQYGQQVFGGHLYDVMPDFRRNYLALRRIDRKYGHTLRKDMPAIDDKQVHDFEAGLAPIRYKDERISAAKLRPVQRQIYLDKVLTAIRDHGVDSAKRFIAKSEIMTDKDRDIIDGHHRWTSAMLLDPKLRMTASFIKANLGKVMSRAQSYTDKVGNKRNK